MNGRLGWRVGWRRLLGSVTAVAVLSAGAVVLPAAPVVAAPSKPARELPALGSAPAPKLKPGVPDGSFERLPGRGGSPGQGKGGPAGFDEARSRLVERSEKSDVFANPDGTKTARMYPEPVNFKDSSGAWRRVDSKVVADGGGLRNGAGPLDVRFAGKADDPSLLRVSSKGTAASFAMDGVGSVAPSAAGSAVTYRGVAPGVDVEYHVGSSSVKELVVLHQRPEPGGDPTFRFPLRLEGLTPELAGDGSIVLRDGQGGEEMVIPAATAWDSAVDPGSSEPVFGPARLGLVEEKAGWVVTLAGDAAWLADPARVYPVYLDPTVRLGRDTNQDDTFVSSRYPTTNYDVAWSSSLNRFEDRVGYYDSSTGTNNTYLWYDFGPVMGADVLSARWNGFFIHSYSASQQSLYRLHPTRCCWDVGRVTWNTQTWWGPEFVDGTGVRNQWSSSDVTGWVRNWASGVWPTTDGISVDTAGQGQGSWKKLAASENTDGTASFVEVTFNRPPDMANGASAAPGEGAVVASTTPTLSVAPAGDADGNPVSYLFRLVTGGDGETGTVVDSGWRASPSWTVPPGSLTDGVVYTWHVYVSDGRLTTGPDWVRRLKVDLRLGAKGPSPTDAAGPVSVNLSNGNVMVGTGSPSMATVGGGVGLSFAYNAQAPPTAGLTGSYSRDENINRVFDDPVRLVRTDPQLSFNWGEGSPYPEAVGADDFLARWTGFVTVPAAGDYFFGAYKDNGLRIWVNNVLVVDRWDGQWGGPFYGGQVSLNAGQTVPIRVEYFEEIGGAAVSLYAKGPVAETVVPASWLSTTAPALPAGWSLSADLDGGAGYTQALLTQTSAVLTDSSGAAHTYSWNGTAYVPPTGEQGVLTKSPDGRLTLADEDGVTYVFDTSGHLASATSAADDRRPAAATYTWVGSPSRLASIGDPVSGRSVTLSYGGDPGCSGPVPAGFDASAPPGMLCAVAFWDGTFSRLWYSAGQLGRLEDPGGEVTDFAYSAGRLTKVRDPLAADAVAAGVAANDDTSRTLIGYDGAGRASSVTLPAPTPGAARPARFYRYVAPGETQVDVAGLAPAVGFATKVTFDSAGRTLTTTDATGRVNTATWSAADDPLSSTDPAGRRTTILYDEAGRPTDSYGPAPAGCFGGDNRPNGSCANPPPAHTSTAYDGGINGLAAAYWDNDTLAGPPKVHGTGVGNPSGALDVDWAGGSPAGLPGVDHWSARFTGEITLPATGTYQFRIASDDGVRLFIDDRLLTELWTPHGRTFTPTGWLDNGTPGSKHRIRVEYFDFDLWANLTLFWTPPGAGETIVPGVNLSPAYGLVTTTTTDDTTPGSPPSTTGTGYANPENGLATTTTTNPGGLGLTTTTAYEAPGAGWLRRTARTLPAGNGWSYASYGATEVAVNPCNTTQQASQAGLERTTTGPDPDGAGPQVPRVETVVHDAAGRPVASRVGTGGWACTAYDARGRPVSSTVPAWGAEPARVVSNSWAVGGNPLVTSLADAAGTVTTTVDLLGRVVAYTDVWAKTTTNTYDQTGRVTRTAGPAGTLEAAYDDAGRVLTQRLDGVLVAQPVYDTAGEPVSVSYPAGVGNGGNGTSGTVIRDPAGRTANMTWKRPDASVLTSDSVTYSQSGRVVDESIDGADPRAGNPNFTYDSASRLTAAWVPGHALTYGFASTGGCGALTGAGANTNRTSTTDNGGTTTAYCYDAADRLTSTTDTRYTGPVYDSRGNTTTLGPQTLSYDGADRHTQTTTAGVTVRYGRDATDRITERKVAGVTVARYGHSGSGDTPEFTMDATGTVIERTLGLVGGASLTKRAGGDVWSYPNIHGDITATADAVGTKTGSTLTYDPYGQALTGLPDNSTGNLDYGWLGTHQRPLEHEGTLNTIEMGARQYVPGLGRFLEVDPVEAGSSNDYDYVMGDPVNLKDLDGRCGFCRSIGRFVKNNRHRIVDVGVSIFAATFTAACIASVACGVGLFALGMTAIIVAGIGTHYAVATKRDRQRNKYRYIPRTFRKAGQGAVCGAIFRKGCATGAGGYIWSRRRGRAPGHVHRGSK